jgi:mitochondrial chaperone BCS1
LDGLQFRVFFLSLASGLHKFGSIAPVAFPSRPFLTMDFNRLQRQMSRMAARGVSSTNASNATQSPNDLNNLIDGLPLPLLDALIPGFGLASRLILQLAGIDISQLFQLGVVLFSIGTTALYLYRKVSYVVVKYLTSSIFIDESDDLFVSLMEYLAVHTLGEECRTLKAVTRKKGGINTNQDAAGTDELDSDFIDHRGFFNLRKWSARVKPRFEPYYGRYWFWHRGQPIIFNRVKQSRAENMARIFGSADPADREVYVKLTCMGRSTEPLKQLLHDIKIWNIEREKSLTVIRRAVPAMGGRVRRMVAAWDRVTARPSRAMETVVLDSDQKEKLINDVNEYLHPSSARWYANRGIPYRRGYLFYGPPGTGKTSLSFALAGVFGLEIFVCSLSEPNFTEGELSSLFNSLPRRCIVLLEDIDTAGLAKRDKERRKIEDQELKSGKPDGEENGPKNKITLSGLLNAIDGVAAHEGRVLVMTSNHPEKLDSALVRPGRIDMQIHFGLATKQQIRELFLRMYAGLETLGEDVENDEKSGMLGGDVTPVGSREELEQLADKFAMKLDESTFSPAEIQGFLLVRRKQPFQAVEDVEAWKQETLAKREAANGHPLSTTTEESTDPSRHATGSSPVENGDNNTNHSGKLSG